MIFELLDHLIEVGIAGAETAREPVSATPGNLLAVGEHFELSCLAGDHGGCDSEILLDEGHETRDLGLVILSGGAVDDFDFHGRPPRWPDVEEGCRPQANRVSKMWQRLAFVDSKSEMPRDGS